MTSRKKSHITWMVPIAVCIVLVGVGLRLQWQSSQKYYKRIGDELAQRAAMNEEHERSLYRHLRVGEMNDAGRLLFWRLNDASNGEPFFLSPGDDYGAILINQGSDSRPLARYVFASQSTGKVLDTRNYSEFRKALAAVPKSSTIGIYETCSISRAYGLPMEVIDDFEKALQQSGSRIEREDARTVCYCWKP